jgi:fumarylacetoacetase
MSKNATSWITIDKTSGFTLANIPFGIINTPNGSPRVASAIGNYAIDIQELAKRGYLENIAIDHAVFKQDSLNAFIALGKTMTRGIRNRLISLFEESNAQLQNNKEDRAAVLIPLNEVELLLPVHVGDYTDFYSSIEHATNVGIMFRDPANALLPNWKHIPVGYHGRASSIIASGVDVHRPKGQTKPNESEGPVFGPSKQLDFELEMAFITHEGKPLGESISTEEADDYIFGMAIFNDWSARDIQKWEYIPLGPFLGKNFASSVSPWIVTLDALEAFRTKGVEQDPKVLPYLQYQGNKNIDIKLEVIIETPEGVATTVSNSNYKHMYWNMNQQLAHHTINGCNIKAGDLYASGTISGPTPDSFGSMLELAWKGTRPVKLNDGTERKFLHDNDTVIMKAFCEKEGLRLGFGEVRTKIVPAH